MKKGRQARHRRCNAGSRLAPTSFGPNWPPCANFTKRLDITQVELAAELGIGQEGVSRLERRNDTLVSALRKAVAKSCDT